MHLEEQKPVRVRVTLILDVDTNAWALEYGFGVNDRRGIQNDVKDYIRNVVQCGEGGFENMTVVETK